MKVSRTVEILVGLFMLAGLLALFFLAMQVSNLGTARGGDGYTLYARFTNIGGLKVRSPVTVAGVRIGQVKHIGYDQETFEAVVTLNINQDFARIPEDTFARILTQGLLGEQYVGLDPGGSNLYLHDGDEVQMTQSAVMLEDMVGRFLFGGAEEANSL
ncbi:MAG: outer membrane lipid asymmetry maintenance protein MlaD [Pseudomonadota bacterium]